MHTAIITIASVRKATRRTSHKLLFCTAENDFFPTGHPLGAVVDDNCTHTRTTHRKPAVVENALTFGKRVF